MMKRQHKTESGFSAVELLITLFIAALFLLAGNQLYTYVLRSGVESNQQAKASAIGYEYLKSKEPTVSDPCDSSTPATQTFNNVPVDEVKNVKIVVSVSCPYSSASAPLNSISKVTSKVTYGTDTPQKEVKHEIYVNP